MVNDFDTPPITHFQLKNRNGIFSKFGADFASICSEKCDLILDIVFLIILPRFWGHTPQTHNMPCLWLWLAQILTIGEQTQKLTYRQHNCLKMDFTQLLPMCQSISAGKCTLLFIACAICSEDLARYFCVVVTLACWKNSLVASISWPEFL